MSIIFFSNSDSSKAIATCSFKIRCLCNFSKAKPFIINFSMSVNFDCPKISGPISVIVNLEIVLV